MPPGRLISFTIAQEMFPAISLSVTRLLYKSCFARIYSHAVLVIVLQTLLTLPPLLTQIRTSKLSRTLLRKCTKP